MRQVLRFARQISRIPFYRGRPIEAARLAYAKYLLSRHRVETPGELLLSIGIDPEPALAGIARWSPLLSPVLGKRVHGVSKEDGLILYGAIRASKPEYVIETGVAEGVATSFIMAALVENGSGTLYSIDLPPDRAASQQRSEDGARFRWVDGGLASLVPQSLVESMHGRWHLLLGDVREVLPPLLDRLPYVDLFFHDDLHTPDHMLWEYDLIWSRMRPGALLLSDDANHGWVRFLEKQRLGTRPLVNVQRLTAVRKQEPGERPPRRERGRRAAR